MAGKPVSGRAWRALLPLLAIGLFAGPALAIEYRSVSEATVLYDAPSQKGKPLFVIRKHTPVELVVNLEGWSKVRDASGGLAWIERQYLGEARTLQVTAERIVVRDAPSEDAASVFEAGQGVALELLEPSSPGWVKVRHADGASGFARVADVWGL